MLRKWCRDYRGYRLFRFVKRALLASVLGVLFTTHLLIAKTMATHPGDGDFPTFYLTSVRMRYAEKVYWFPSGGKEVNGQGCDPVTRHLTLAQVITKSGPELAKMRPCLHSNLNPPFMIALAGPLAYLDYPLAWWASWLASLSCIVLVGRLLVSSGLMPGLYEREGIILWIAYFAYFPTILTFVLGQVTFWVLLPIVLAWLRLRRGSDGYAGAWLGLAAAMKPFVGLFLIGLVALKNWRACLSMVMVGLVCTLFGGWILGYSSYLAYLKLLGVVDWQAAHWNASFAGFFTRLFGEAQNRAWLDEPESARTAAWLAVLALLICYLYAIRRCCLGPRDYRSDALCALTIPAMLLISPLGWIYYFPMLLVPFLFLWRKRSISYRGFPVLVLISMAMTTVPSQMSLAEEMREPQQWLGVSAIYLGGLLGVFALTVYEILGEPIKPADLQGRV